jgi:multidrug resistance efflux pump
VADRVRIAQQAVEAAEAAHAAAVAALEGLEDQTRGYDADEGGTR